MRIPFQSKEFGNVSAASLCEPSFIEINETGSSALPSTKRLPNTVRPVNDLKTRAAPAFITVYSPLDMMMSFPTMYGLLNASRVIPPMSPERRVWEYKFRQMHINRTFKNAIVFFFM